MPRGASLRHGSRRTTVPPPPAAPGLAWLERRGGSFVLLGLILAAAAALRLWGLAYRDLWFDELGALAMASSGDWWVGEGGNPPLFFAVLGGWIRAVGTGIAAVRLPSALAALGAVAALWWVAAELRLPPSMRAWGVSLFAASPLQIYYAQETRAYALLILLILLALGSILRAMATGSRPWWTAHGVFVVAGLYTHNMMIPVVGAFWASALIFRLPRARWIELAAVHTLAAGAYAPWIPRLLDQAASHTHDWIVEFFRDVSVPGLVLSSMEAFNPGGWWPEHLNFPANLQTPPWSAMFFAAAGLMALFAGLRARRESPDFARALGVLLVFAAAPIAFLLVYSVLETPLYLVGRYDLPAQPTYLLLMGVGVHELVRRGARFGRVGAVLPVVPLAAIVVLAIVPKLALGNAEAPRHRSQRLAAELAAWGSREDVVVALDISEHLASYVLQQAGLPLTFAKFPRERLDHLDRAALDREVRTNLPAFRGEAAALAVHAKGRRIWLIESPIYDDLEKPRTPYESLKQALLTELRQHLVRTAPPGPTLYQLHAWLLDPQ